MSKGIALQFKEAYPEIFRIYKKVCQKKELQIGNMLIVKDSDLTSGYSYYLRYIICWKIGKN